MYYNFTQEAHNKELQLCIYFFILQMIVARLHELEADNFFL